MSNASAPDKWWDVSWNPVTGCTPISEGCQNCYAARMAKRLAGRCGYPADDPFRVTFHPERLDLPLKWHKPRKIFTCSQGDLFHENLTWEQQLAVVEAMDGPHTYMILTKRPQQIKRFFQQVEDWDPAEWPHIWLGVTAESQPRADERTHILLQIPARVRFVCVEPMLGPVNLRRWLPPFMDCDHYDGGCTRPENVFAETGNPSSRAGLLSCGPDKCVFGRRGLDWVICGAETGPGARPMNPDWARALRDQCDAAEIPFWMKKMSGGKEPPPDLRVRQWPHVKQEPAR